MTQWEKNAKTIEEEYGMQVDWEERFYICPECGEPVYEDDWGKSDLVEFLCPICEDGGENEEEEEW